YALAMALLSKVVLSIPLGITYALWSGIGTVVIVLVGRFAYSQMLQPAQLIGIALITAGVVLVNLGE
ncbi:MAG: QacE family quaternary ammonium compound efflux SMR transporter, partial [Synechococcus sp.]|nr:QacE family quaternary ammonium compound efflux SMR transporter [Synechococcus sp.]